MEITFHDPQAPFPEGTQAVRIKGDESLSPTMRGFAQRAEAFLTFPEDENKKAHVLETPEGGTCVFYALGDTPIAWREAGALITKALREEGQESFWVQLPDKDSALQFALGVLLRNYRFGYKPLKKGESVLNRLTIVVPDAPSVATAFERMRALADGVYFARDCINEPANVLNPETYADKLLALTSSGLSVSVLGEERLKELGMNLLLAVGQGSPTETKLVVLEWKGGAKESPPLAFVGKGVTFDTGGISLKPTQFMAGMHTDMGGSAVIAGAMLALAKSKAPINAVAVLGLVDNAFGGRAMRPGDIVCSASGKTVDILNTDGEGRLVLADAVWFCQKEFAPACLVDLATLTGAALVALGREYAGVFTKDRDLWARLESASHVSGEDIWRLPLHPHYDRALNSPVADVQNIAGEGKGAGSSMGAHFIGRFIEEGTRWAHMDVAPVVGIAWDDAVFHGKDCLSSDGVLLLEAFAREGL